MSLTNVPLWSTTAATNTDVGGNTLAENAMLPSGTNNSFRELMSEVAKLYDDLGGVNTVAGTGDAVTITTSSVFTALATGLIVAFKASATNTTNVTLAVDGLTAKAIRKFTTVEAALVAGDLVSGMLYQVIYDAAANSAAGAWILQNPPGTLMSKVSTDTMTNKTFDTAGTGNSFSINGVAATGNTGTGLVVRDQLPTIANLSTSQDQSQYAFRMGRFSSGFGGTVFNCIDTAGGSNHPTFYAVQFNGTQTLKFDSTGAAHFVSNTATPAGGTAGYGITLGTTTNLGVFFGSGAPTLSAAQGSLYIRSDGSSTSTRMYINTNGSTTWTNVTTAA